MIFNFLLAFGLSCAVGGVLIENSNSSHIFDDSCFRSTINNKVETSESESESSSEVSYPIYDDHEMCITFNANQLNNYHFDNFGYVLEYNLSTSLVQDSYITYDGEDYQFDELVNSEGYYSLIYRYNDNEIHFDTDTNLFYLIIDSVDATFSNNLLWFLEQRNVYENVKSAIQADIQANEQSGNMATLQDILSDIVSLLTSGIVGMATGLASGVNTTIRSLVVDNGATSIFLGVVAIFGGIALAVGITRRIFAWVESLGAKG